MSSGPLRRTGLESLLEERGDVGAESSDVVVRVHANSGFVNLRGDATQPGFVAAVGQSLGQPLPVAANTLSSGPSEVYWLGPDEWLIVADIVELTTQLLEPLRNATRGFHSAVNDLSGGLVGMTLKGEGVVDILAKGSTLDFHPDSFAPGACAQTGLAKAPIVIGVIDSAPTFGLVVRRSFCDYLLRWIAHSALPPGPQVVVE